MPHIQRINYARSSSYCSRITNIYYDVYYVVKRVRKFKFKLIIICIPLILVSINILFHFCVSSSFLPLFPSFLSTLMIFRNVCGSAGAFNCRPIFASVPHPMPVPADAWVRYVPWISSPNGAFLRLTIRMRQWRKHRSISWRAQWRMSWSFTVICCSSKGQLYLSFCCCSPRFVLMVVDHIIVPHTHSLTHRHSYRLHVHRILWELFVCKLLYKVNICFYVLLATQRSYGWSRFSAASGLPTQPPPPPYQGPQQQQTQQAQQQQPQQLPQGYALNGPVSLSAGGYATLQPQPQVTQCLLHRSLNCGCLHSARDVSVAIRGLSSLSALI